MPPEVGIEHRYPQALAFLQTHGPDSVAILHDLLARADERDGVLVVEASVRQVADRLGFVSKDTVHRRLRRLLRAGVLHRQPADPARALHRPAYTVDLTGTGIVVHRLPAVPAPIAVAPTATCPSA